MYEQKGISFSTVLFSVLSDFSFIVVLSDSLAFICEETINIVSLSIPSETSQGCALSDLCLLLFRKPPFALFAVYRTGFLTYSCAVKDAVFDSGLTESLFEPNED